MIKKRKTSPLNVGSRERMGNSRQGEPHSMRAVKRKEAAERGSFAEGSRLLAIHLKKLNKQVNGFQEHK